jgi:hypothetical protein
MTSSASVTIQARPRVDAFLARVNPVRSRVIIALDATASRQPTWDTAAKLTADMFNAVAGLDVQLAWFRGWTEIAASSWLSDPKALTSVMSKVMCAAGQTQIGKVVSHARKEHQQKKVDALVLIGDAC